MIAEVAKRLHQDKKKLDFGLYVVNSVQEEIGLRGAQMIAERIDPDVAIITDVTHDTNSPMYDKKKSGDIKSGDGPALTFGPAVQNNRVDPAGGKLSGHLPLSSCESTLRSFQSELRLWR